MSEIKLKFLLTFPISGPIDKEIDWTMPLSIQHTATIFEVTSTRYSLEIPFYVSIILKLEQVVGRTTVPTFPHIPLKCQCVTAYLNICHSHRGDH